MPSGWASTPGGVDSGGYYTAGVSGWSQITPYFQNLILRRITLATGHEGAAQLYGGANSVINAQLVAVYGVGGGFTEYDSFKLRSSFMGDGNTYGDTTGGYDLARTCRHELGHAIDFACWGYDTAVTVTSDTTLVAKYTSDIKPSLNFGSLSVNAYSRNSVYEWFAEFFSEMMAERVLGYAGVCDGDAIVPGPNCVWAINWFNTKFPGWTTRTAPAITSSSPAVGTNGASYSHGFTASGSSAVWSKTAGTLPPGLSLNSTSGVLSGTPASTASYTYTIAATNVAGSVTQSYTTVIAAGSAGGPVVTSPTVDDSVYADIFDVTLTSAATGTPTPTVLWEYCYAPSTTFIAMTGSEPWLLPGTQTTGSVRILTDYSGSSLNVRARWTNSGGSGVSAIKKITLSEGGG